MATDLTQGEHTVTISCVVPIVLTLRKSLLSKVGTVRYHAPMVDELYKSLDRRFISLLEQLEISSTQKNSGRDLAFGSPVFLMAAAMDPKYSFRWLIDHPGSDVIKQALRHRITGIYYL